MSTASALIDVCGPLVYTITEAHPFISIDPLTNTITVLSTNMLHIGIYTATLSASLANYPLVTAAQIAFSVTLVDPCLTTVLTLPTTLLTFTITAFDGIGFT